LSLSSEEDSLLDPYLVFFELFSGGALSCLLLGGCLLSSELSLSLEGYFVVFAKRFLGGDGVSLELSVYRFRSDLDGCFEGLLSSYRDDGARGFED